MMLIYNSADITKLRDMYNLNLSIMKMLKKLLLLVISLIGFTTNAFADKHPEANFGTYGIKHFATVVEYQQNYVGQVVQYIQQIEGGSNMDTHVFQDAGGKFNTDYVISKISGNDKRMTWILLEKGSKKKVKMVVNNQDESWTYGKSYYCITDKYSIPLFLSDKFKADRLKYIGKVFPDNSDSPTKFEVTDVIMQPHEVSTSIDYRYPQACLVLKDKANGNVITYDVESIDDLNDLGKVFTNPKFKCTYTVVKVFQKISSTIHQRVEYTKYYTLKNSIDGTTKDIKAASAKSLAFKNDDSGKFFVALTKVEKPSNPDVRYGKTTNVTEKDITKYSYEDNFINILIFAASEQFNFILKNVSDNTLKVVWNEAVFVDVDGSTSKVMHSGIKYSQREADQPASTIIKGAKLEDLAAPTDKVYYSEKLNKWTSESLYANAKQELEGQTIKLMLPIQVKDVINEYVFEFTLTYVYNHPEYIAE